MKAIKDILWDTHGMLEDLLEDLPVENYRSARSSFQIQHFVVDQHATHERQWSQLMCEIRTGAGELARRRLECRSAERDIQAAKLEVDEIEMERNEAWRQYSRLERWSWIVGTARISRAWNRVRRLTLQRDQAWQRINEAKMTAEQAEQAYRDKLTDMQRLCRLAREYMASGHAYTDGQIEQAEPEYWKLRLREQALQDLLSRQTGVGVGNLRAIRNAGFEIDSLIEGKEQVGCESGPPKIRSNQTESGTWWCGTCGEWMHKAYRDEAQVARCVNCQTFLIRESMAPEYATRNS